MKTMHLLTAGLLVALACSSVAGAEDHGDVFAFNAFGTLGIAHSSEGEADFTRNILVPRGAGASQEWSPKVDSVLGGQIAVHFTSTLSAVVQVVSELRENDSFDPRIEWANLKYEITPDLTVAAGRIVTPILMFTDTRRVSYALPWIRPPEEVYELYPVTSSDGANMRWRTRFGETTHTLEMVYGRADAHYSRNGSAGKVQARKQFLLRTLMERGPLSFSVGYSPAVLTLPAFAPLIDAFRQFGPQGQGLADRYSADHRSSTYLGAGASYDPGRWFVMAEWARDELKGVVGNHWGWYASTGLRYGAFTPYITWAQTRPSHARFEPGLDLATLPAESVAVAAVLNAQLNAALANVPDQSTLSAGVRWDFARSLCLKLQYDQIDLAPGNGGTLTNFQPGFQPGGKLNVVGASVSFVL